MDNRIDRSSQSNFDEAVSKHIDITWVLDFNAKVLSGKVKHTVEILQESTVVEFDSSDLSIGRVSLNGETALYEISEKVNSLGQKISVSIPSGMQKKTNIFDVTFEYTTYQDASAIQWLDATATLGKIHPFVFTQSQGIC